MELTKQKLLELLNNIKVARVEKIEKHPDADRLLITQINDGEDLKQVVTGANNFKEGDLVPYLGVGFVVPGFLIFGNQEITLQKKPLRGVDSYGMILAEDEIGLGHDHTGILIIKSEILNSKFQLDGILGKSFAEVLVEEKINKIFSNAGVVEITPEVQKKIDLIMSVGNPEHGGEVIGLDELPKILTSNEPLYTYDGFEPSGQMHIAQGIIRAINTNKMIEAGFIFRMYVADWFGYLNNKMGGDLEKIKKVGEYFIELWRASGMNLDGVEFIWTSDVVKDPVYWETVMKVSKSATLKRILRTTEIMGRSEEDDLSGAQILYPCMQTADIFHVMKCQVTQLGLDQRKVNMLAREVGQELGYWKPVVVSHGMLQGLGKPASKDADPQTRAISMKMSKSKPDTAIFMTDSKKEIERKIMKAYCPPNVKEDNPILDYCKQIIFEAKYLKRQSSILNEKGFEIKRDEKYGGNVSYNSYKELEADYVLGKLDPADLKPAVIEYLDMLLQPVREHFENDENAKRLLEEVKSFQVTR